MQQLKQKLQAQLAARYPEHADDNGDGRIPPAVEAAIKKSMRDVPGVQESGVLHKHATPAASPDELVACLNQAPSSSLFEDTSGDDLVQKHLQHVHALAKHSELRATTGTTMVHQWNPDYLPLAFPFSLARPVGDADFPRHPSKRRQDAHHGDANFVRFEPWQYMRSLPARVEGNVRGSWPLVPSVRNLTLKWDALCGEEAACRHAVDRMKAGNVHAAELSKAAANVYEQLQSGHWWDGKKKRRINNDVSKLALATNLSEMERNLVKDLLFLQKKHAGTQQVRVMIGHALFGARVEFGDPYFMTISPTSRHSALAIRLSRFRQCDPAMGSNLDDRSNFSMWSSAKRPRIFAHASGDDVILELPQYKTRCEGMASDPWAVVLSFSHSVTFLLPRALGMQMCPICPRCNISKCPCSNAFGHNMLPTGGLPGLGVAFGGSVEYQQNWNPHFHGNIHTASVYQYKTLTEIAEMMESNLLTFESLAKYQSWMHREDHFNHDSHQANLVFL